MRMRSGEGSGGIVEYECISDDDDVNAYERQPSRDKGKGRVDD